MGDAVDIAIVCIFVAASLALVATLTMLVNRCVRETAALAALEVVQVVETPPPKALVGRVVRNPDGSLVAAHVTPVKPSLRSPAGRTPSCR